MSVRFLWQPHQAALTNKSNDQVTQTDLTQMATRPACDLNCNFWKAPRLDQFWFQWIWPQLLLLLHKKKKQKKKLTSKFPININKLVYHQSLSKSHGGKSCHVFLPLETNKTVAFNLTPNAQSNVLDWQIMTSEFEFHWVLHANTVKEISQLRCFHSVEPNWKAIYILNTQHESIHILNTQHESIHILNTQHESIHILNTQHDSIHILNTQHDSIHILNTQHDSIYILNLKICIISIQNKSHVF